MLSRSPRPQIQLPNLHAFERRWHDDDVSLTPHRGATQAILARLPSQGVLGPPIAWLVWDCGGENFVGYWRFSLPSAWADRTCNLKPIEIGQMQCGIHISPHFILSDRFLTHDNFLDLTKNPPYLYCSTDSNLCSQLGTDLSQNCKRTEKIFLLFIFHTIVYIHAHN